MMIMGTQETLFDVCDDDHHIQEYEVLPESCYMSDTR